MTEFDKLNLRVVPIENMEKFHKLPNYKGYPVKWSDPSNYCDWEEREDVYPGVKDWYVIPPARSTFIEDGIEVGYWVIDIDNHEGDKYEEAIEFLRSCKIPPSLTIRTPSGGLHIYYKALKDDLPAPLGRSKEFDLPIEIKTSVGVVAPNGRDRVVIRDLPVAYFSITEDNPLSKIAKLKQKRVRIAKKETDPNFPIEEEPFPEVGQGDRHNTLMATACSLYARGCPPEKIQEWGEEFYRRTNRKQQPNEISNIVRDAVRYVDGEEDVNEQLLVELEQEAEEDAQDTDVLTFEDIFPGAEELTGWESIYAQVLFSTKEEAYNLIAEELEKHPGDTPAETKFLADMFSADLSTMKRLWAANPSFQQKYLWYKDCMKEVQAK